MCKTYTRLRLCRKVYCFTPCSAQRGDPYLLMTQLSFDSRAGLDSYLSALQKVVDRHDTLRTSITWEGLSEPVQVVWRRAAVKVEELALNISDGDIAQQLYERFHPRCYRLDLGQAPLMRVFTAQDSANERWLLLMLVHHIVDDNTSLRRMRRRYGCTCLGKRIGCRRHFLSAIWWHRHVWA